MRRSRPTATNACGPESPCDSGPHQSIPGPWALSPKPLFSHAHDIRPNGSGFVQCFAFPLTVMSIFAVADPS